MDESNNHDNLLFEVLKDCKTLPVFLDQIFGFLKRRTDFYHIATEPNSPVGLPPGLAEKVVKQSFYKWKLKDKIVPQANVPAALDEVEIAAEPSKLPEKGKKETAEDLEFTSSECYNGAKFDKYSWSQSLLEVDISVKLPPNTTAKDLNVTILANKISVRLKSNLVLLEGDLCDKCKHNEAIWSLHKSKLDIHLDKARELWWNCLIQTETKLDVSKLDCSRPYEELPDEAQAKIEELQWNQERKRLGLPTSDQLVAESMLKKSWKAQGSPFTGPFDPTACKFS